MKSALIGGFVVVLILFGVGAVIYEPSIKYRRFEIEVNDGHAFVLDTATGQVWSEMFPDLPSGFIVVPDPNFYAPKTLPYSTTEP